MEMKGYTLYFPLGAILLLMLLASYLASIIGEQRGAIESLKEAVILTQSSGVACCDFCDDDKKQKENLVYVMTKEIQDCRSAVTVLGALTGHDMRIFWEDPKAPTEDDFDIP